MRVCPLNPILHAELYHVRLSSSLSIFVAQQSALPDLQGYRQVFEKKKFNKKKIKPFIRVFPLFTNKKRASGRKAFSYDNRESKTITNRTAMENEASF